MKKYETAKPYDPDVLEKLHTVHIEILDDFKAVCEKYQLPYFALFGTAIGTAQRVHSVGRRYRRRHAACGF